MTTLSSPRGTFVVDADRQLDGDPMSFQATGNCRQL
jgi:hypothetical protein